MGSSGGGAQREAQAAEARRQAQIAQTTRRINQIYDSPDRQKQYADFGSAQRDLYMQEADRQKGVADRELKFALARSGLTGGSAAVDANRRLGEEYSKGVLESERQAQAAVANLRQSDEGSRANLMALAQSGLNASAASTQAAAALRSNLESAQSASRVDSLGDLFGSVMTAKKRSEEEQAKRRADRAYTNNYGPFWSLGEQ
jgi:hypothetical protein